MKSFDFALTHDPDFMQKCIDDTKRCYDATLKFFEGVRDGRLMDSQYDQKTGEVVQKPIPMDVRVKAAAQLKSMTLDKFLADKRDSGKKDDRKKAFDHEASLKRIMDEKMRREAEEKALKDGKLLKIADNG